MYTDGVTEAMNSTQEMYLEERLLKFLEGYKPETVNKLVRGVIVDVLQYMGKADQADDITVLSLEYRGNGASEHDRVDEHLQPGSKPGSLPATERTGREMP